MIPKELENVDWQMMPVHAIRAVFNVMLNAVPSKGRETWKHDKTSRSYKEQVSHAQAHILNALAGDDVDDDGELNLSHAATRLLLVVDNIITGRAIDDRGEYGKK